MSHKLTNQYMAGFFDGEGSIYFSKQKPDKTHLNYHYGPRVVITNSNIGVLKLMNQKYQLGKIRFAKQATNKKIYDIRFASPPVIIKFLEKILPFLILKKGQAELMLDYFQNRQISVYVKGHHGFKPLDKKELRKRRWYYLRLRELNRS